MTAVSFGRRSRSYGFLQNATDAAALPLRKAPKVLPSGAREKESRLRSMLRALVRRNVGALVVFIVCAVILIPHISFSTVYVQHIIYLSSSNFQLPQHIENDDTESNTTSVIIGQSTQRENGINLPIPILPLSTFSHPCENFSFPPPPANSKRTGPRPCPVCYIPQEQAMALMPDSPSVSPVLKNLAYVLEENLIETKTDGGFVFGGYPSLQQRTESFDIRESMSVHCGFVRGKKPGQGTGFDIDDADRLEMEQCRGIVVASAIFGNFDIMQPPKNIRETVRRSVCFYMFVDEETEASIKNSSTLDIRKRVWKVVVVRNLPYRDSRRNGKVPKLLLHRLFPNARFSLWIDGKLQLIVDPYQILERFLWRKNATFAISRHYIRFDVFEEAEANKAGGKYNNASIDSQIEFYKKEGLAPYSIAKLPITSDVPEGCVIIREHVPIANLFSCLWFNEVERFTSRDQLSFSTVRDKIRSKVNWSVNMFNDCERRNFVIQSHHKDLLDRMNSAASHNYPPPPPALASESGESPRKLSPGSGRKRAPTPPVVRRGRDRRSGGSRRRRSGATHGRDTNSS